MKQLRVLLIVGSALLAFSCGDNQNESEMLDGVYHRATGFESEIVVLHGNTFEWWFTMDEPLPNIFPLRGTFEKQGNRLELRYEFPEEKKDELDLVSPPRFLELVNHPSPLIRSHRFAWEDFKEFSEKTEGEFEAVNRKEDHLLFKTKLRPGDSLNAAIPFSSNDYPKMIVPDQQARYRKAFNIDES